MTVVTEAMVERARKAYVKVAGYEAKRVPKTAMQAALTAALAQNTQGEAVAEVCSMFELRWVGDGSISRIVDRHGIKVGDKLYLHAERARVPEQPQPMDTAPRDGTMLRLLVRFTEHATDDAEEAWTIGSNSFDANGEDAWQFAGWCWTHDHFTDGKGTPIGWLPMLNATMRQQAGRIDEEMVERGAEAAWNIVPRGAPFAEASSHIKNEWRTISRAILTAALAQPAQAVDVAYDDALNEAGWAFIEAMPERLPGPIFNNVKAALKAAIEKWLATRALSGGPVGDGWTGEIECCDAKGFWLVLADNCPFVPGQKVTITPASPTPGKEGQP